MRHTLLTCPRSRSSSFPARTKLASRSPYVPARPQHLLPGTDWAGISLSLRARPAAALPHRHVPGWYFALLTCPLSRSSSFPARNILVSRSPYVPGQPQPFRTGTYRANISLPLRARSAAALPSRHGLSLHHALLTCLAGHSTPFQTRIGLAFRSPYVRARPQLLLPGTDWAGISLSLRARSASAPPSRHVPDWYFALLTCPHSRNTSAPTRIELASRSPYVPHSRSTSTEIKNTAAPFCRCGSVHINQLLPGAYFTSGKPSFAE